MDNYFKTQVERVQIENPHLIEERVNVHDDFSIIRSIGKSSTSRAAEVGVSSRDIDLINRWRNTERQEKRNLPIRDYYLDLLLVKKKLLYYSPYL